MKRRVAIVLAGSLAACGGGSGDPDAADTDAAAEADAAWDDSTFDLHIFDDLQVTDLAGATVCVVGQSDCQITDANGDATVTVAGPPTDLKLAFAATAAGHLSTVGLGRIFIQLDVDVHTVPSSLGLLADADASDLFTAAGFTYPATATGFVRAMVLDGASLGAEQGATVTLDGSSVAPVYLDDSGQPDPSLTAIGTFGGVLFGDVLAGPFSLTVHVPNKACSMHASAWEGSGDVSPSSAAGVVLAGALTDFITIACYDDGT